MRFLIDAQLPPALVRWLTEQGHYAEHVVDATAFIATDKSLPPPPIEALDTFKISALPR
jgi:predicted nuclease of predicted toxin-antitoxin system